MINNPNQEIHTDYKIYDIFKPVNANQLAKVMVYDFVITQDMFNAYIDAQGIVTGDSVDVGDVIVSAIDGSSKSFESIKAPCSIYIVADTTGYKLDFSKRLFRDTDAGTCVVDTTNYKDATGSYTLDKTRDMLNVYSAHPYTVASLCGGINFWSTVSSYVTLEIPDISWDGLCRIGYYSSPIGFGLDTRMGFQVVLSNLVSGVRPTESPTVAQVIAGYSPAVVFANWMGGAGVSTEYGIASTDSSKPGLFQSIVETLDSYRNEVSICVTSSSTSNIYFMTERSSTELRFTDAHLGTTLVLLQDGTISWESSKVSNRDSILSATVNEINLISNPSPGDLKVLKDSGHIYNGGEMLPVSAGDIVSYTGDSWVVFLHADVYAKTEDLNAHISDYNNPHKVTASQVGAYTKKEVNDLIAKIPGGGGGGLDMDVVSDVVEFFYIKSSEDE